MSFESDAIRYIKLDWKRYTLEQQIENARKYKRMTVAEDDKMSWFHIEAETGLWMTMPAPNDYNYVGISADQGGDYGDPEIRERIDKILAAL